MNRAILSKIPKITMTTPSISSGQKRLDDLNYYLNQPWLCEYAGNKEGYKTASVAFLEQLKEDVARVLTRSWKEQSIADCKISFDPRHLGDAGEPSLYFITTKGTGIALHISDNFIFSGLKLRCSEIMSMNDEPKSPRWLSVRIPYQAIVDSVVKMVSASTPDVCAVNQNLIQERECLYAKYNIRQNQYDLCIAS